MGSIFSEKKADTTKTTCIEITSESYKCIDISAYVPTCIMITNYTPTPFTIPTPTLSGLENEVLPFTEMFGVITNYDSQYSYDIRLSLNGGSISLTGAGTFTWILPSYQNPDFYDNIHTVSVYAYKDDVYSLGNHHSTKVLQEGLLYLSKRSARDYLKADGEYTYFDISIYSTLGFSGTIHFWLDEPTELTPALNRDIIQVLDASGNILVSGSASVYITPTLEMKVLRVAHSINWTYDLYVDNFEEDYGWRIYSQWPTGAAPIVWLEQERLLNQSALNPSLVPTMYLGQVFDYELLNYIDTLVYSAVSSSPTKISVSIIDNILRLTSTSNETITSGTVYITLNVSNPLISADNRTYTNIYTIAYVQPI